MEVFARPGIGAKGISLELQLARDFAGCYVLCDNEVPVYVGISRSVISRLRQHVFGKTHFDASLAFRIATKQFENFVARKMTRSDAMGDERFREAFQNAQSYLRGLKVATIAIENPLELYIFEPYCALELDTHQWNSFVTH
jgi:hypothetical protein